MAIRAWRDRAACATDEGRELVDAAYSSPGGGAARRLIAELCRHCPVRRECQDEAMARPEYGVWGGMTPNKRTRAGGASVDGRAARAKVV